MEGQVVPRDSTGNLVRKAKLGDRAAFDALVERHRARLEAFIDPRLGRQLRPKIGVEDVLQDTFLRAFRSLDRFSMKDEESLCRWLCGIAEHVILYAAQKYQHERTPIHRDLPGGDPSPTKMARRNERFERLRGALADLGAEHREVILLARIERLKIKEIAERMSRSQDAVKQLLARALRKLKSAFGDTESLHLPDRSLEETDHGNE